MKFAQLLIFYCITIILFVIFSYTFTHSKIPDIIFLNVTLLENSFLRGVVYALFISCFIGWYVYFLRYFSDHQKFSDFIKVLIISSLLIFSFPGMLSFDIFNYIATARITYLYMENPYIVMPIDFIKDPMLPFMHAANKTALYGPFWISLTVLPYFLGGGIFLLQLLTFKILVAVFYFLTVRLLFTMTGNVFKTALFALCPVVLIETFVSGHNDIVMVYLLLYGLYLLSKKHFLLSILMLTASILIKFASIVLIPVFIYCAYLSVRKQKIKWERIYFLSGIVMFGIFLLSYFREEIYPWYTMWFLVFLPLINVSRTIKILILTFSLSFLFRYIPYMVLLTHTGITPMLKWVIISLPVAVLIVGLQLKKIWGKIY